MKICLDQFFSVDEKLEVVFGPFVKEHPGFLLDFPPYWLGWNEPEAPQVLPLFAMLLVAGPLFLCLDQSSRDFWYLELSSALIPHTLADINKHVSGSYSRDLPLLNFQSMPIQWYLANWTSEIALKDSHSRGRLYNLVIKFEPLIVAIDKRIVVSRACLWPLMDEHSEKPV